MESLLIQCRTFLWWYLRRAIPDIDARNDLLVDERLLQLVGLLVALLDGELFDLGQLARERLVLTTSLSGLLSCLRSHQGGHVHR